MRGARVEVEGDKDRKAVQESRREDAARGARTRTAKKAESLLEATSSAEPRAGCPAEEPARTNDPQAEAMFKDA